jgi:putative CocE/NonD family hydrolase
MDNNPSDVKGAVLTVQDCYRYNIVYRNGFLKVGLHASWYVGMYKKNSISNKSYTVDSFRTLPLADFGRIVFGEQAYDFDETLKHPDEIDPFWKTPLGGSDSYNALNHTTFPVLLTTGLYDIYTQGVFEMWERMPAARRSNCALLVHPYDHGETFEESRIPVYFENGELSKVAPQYALNWFEHIRHGTPLQFARENTVSHYVMFGNRWDHCDLLEEGSIRHELYLNNRELSETPCLNDEITYTYNPYNPAQFKGGLCNNFGGMQIQDKPNSRYDIISFESKPAENEIYVKGKMLATLRVKSDCEDTCFYVRVSLVKDGIAYGLRDDITSLCYGGKDYTPEQEVELSFTFGHHSFILEKGAHWRVDVSSSAFPLFSIHTNQIGLQSSIPNAITAHNTIVCGKSSFTFFEEQVEQ